MAKISHVWFMLILAEALCCLASATGVDVRTVRNNQQSAVDAKQQSALISKRSIFAPYETEGWFETRSYDGQRTLSLRYCWKETGLALYKQWVQEALDETWHRLKVVNFQPLGVCSESQRDYRDYRLEVSFWNNTCSSFETKKAVVLGILYNSSCRPECTISTKAQERCIKKSTVHEFGHVLGLQHEQYRPDTPAKFARTRCLDYHEVEEEARAKLHGHPRFLGPWDEQSVMNYCSPGAYNSTDYRPLSLGDRAAVLSVYGSTAHFNSSCYAHYGWDPFSAACLSAVQRFCQTLFEDVQSVIGVLRGVTSRGLNVTCFKADFIERTQDNDDDDARHARVSEDEQFDADDVCASLAASFPASKKNFSKQFVGIPIDVGVGGFGRVTACKEPIWLGSLNEADLSLLTGEVQNWRCLVELFSSDATGYVLPCVALVDHYCAQSQNGAAGGILGFDKDAAVLKIVCFQALLKIELSAGRAIRVNAPPRSTTIAPTPTPTLTSTPTANSTPNDYDPDEVQDPDPGLRSDSKDDSESDSDSGPDDDTGSGSAADHGTE